MFWGYIICCMYVFMTKKFSFFSYIFWYGERFLSSFRKSLGHWTGQSTKEEGRDEAWTLIDFVIHQLRKEDPVSFTLHLHFIAEAKKRDPEISWNCSNFTIPKLGRDYNFCLFSLIIDIPERNLKKHFWRIVLKSTILIFRNARSPKL